MRIKFLLVLITVWAGITAFAQDDDLFNRLQGISVNRVNYFNVDGIEIISQTKPVAFNAKSIGKNFRHLKINEKELVVSDSSFAFPNFYLLKTEENVKGLKSNNSYYFIEDKDKNVTSVVFGSVNKVDKEFERRFVLLLRDNAIPDSVFNSFKPDSINFAGRGILLGGACQWMGVNNIQCPGNGQMNWSVHKTPEDAAKAVDDQFLRIASANKGKIVSDSTVTVIFEGSEITARKIIYDFKGIGSVITGMSGAKTLTVYFVAAPVRGYFVSCVMSFWNNDRINPDGLAPLLGEVMQLKN